MKNGFTLLELLIVVVILGVLALIAAPTLLNAADQAKVGTVKANISSVSSSITSRFALNSNETATQSATAVVTALNANNTNPINSANAAFALAGTAPGSVVLTPDDTAAQVTIKGYDKNSNVVLTKVIAAPSSN